MALNSADRRYDYLFYSLCTGEEGVYISDGVEIDEAYVIRRLSFGLGSLGSSLASARL